MNIFSRAKHIAKRGDTAWEKTGLALQTTLMSSNAVAKMFKIDHAVFALEGHSWRKAVYPAYKANRAEQRALRTPAEVEEDTMFYAAYDSLVEFLTTKTNVSCIKCPNAEADDVIARFVYLHPNDEIIINTADTDYDQLLTDKIKRYNGVTGELFTVNGVFDDRYKPIKDNKTGLQKTVDDPKFILFEKCVRGDKSDNVFSAYPGVRTKGSKSKAGIMEAYADITRKGYIWNAFMQNTWKDHNNVEKRVLDEYERNVRLIDLTAQPVEIKEAVDAAIRAELNVTPKPQIGWHFLKFCGKFELNRLKESPNEYVTWMTSPYKGHLKVE